jgi:membrane peptidoglycan carboxypeptidase
LHDEPDLPAIEMNRTQQIQRWRRYRRARSGPHVGRWIVRLGAAFILVNVIIGIGLASSAMASVAGVYAYFAKDLPDPTAIQTEQVTYETVKIYDRTGQHLLYESIDPRPFRGDRTYLTIDKIPKALRNATVALEDRTFYTNIGVNPRGLARAFISNLRGQSVQGGSSITQQLVKNILIDPEERYQVSYARKIKEAIMAIEITRKFPGPEGKDQILEWYLNYNFYGNAAYGVEAAAQVYYDKPVSDLTLDEIAVLAAIPQYPGLNPIQAPADAYRRQRKVLSSMQEAGYLTQEEADAAARYFNTSLLNELVDEGLLRPEDLPLVAQGNRAATARALNALVKADYISQAEADVAKKLPGPLWQYVRESAQERFEVPPDAPHFALHVLEQLQQEYNTPEDPYFIWQNGLQVYTTLDWELQTYAECVARSHIGSLRLQDPKPCQNDLEPLPAVPEALQQDFDHEVTNASVVAIRPATGEVLTMVGSLDYFDQDIDGQVNVALSSRQPGSSFKPYTYLTGFESGRFSPSSMVMDVRTVFPDPGNPPYVPENYDRKYHGPQMLRWALQRSYNIPAVWLMDQVGISNVIKTARRVGVSSLNKELGSYGLSLTLGGGEVALLDHTYAFSTFANSGVMAGQRVAPEQQRPGYRKLDPVYVLKVTNKDGKVLEEYRQPDTERVVDPAPMYMLNNVLSDPSPRPVAFGSYANYLTLPNRPVAAKTGTTNSWVDAWTMGYTPQLAVGVWTGNSDSSPMKLADGSITAAPIFQRVLAKGMEGLPVEGWSEPGGLEKARVCVPSGLLPTPDCPRTTGDLFLAGQMPKQPDNIYQAFEINSQNGKRATACTPPEIRQRVVYEVYPANAADWVREQGIPQPPVDIDGPCGEFEAAGDVAIAGPLFGQRVKGIVPIMGNARGPDFRAYRLEVASESAPDQWIPIGPEHGEQISNGQLETWDTTGFEGLYTLRLVALQNGGGVQTNEVQVVVDNTPPVVTIVHPQNDQKYVKEDDELVSITADAQDEWEMDRVEFYLDGAKLGESTVAPYSLRWTITMSDVVPALGPPIMATRTITNPDGTVNLEEYVVQQTSAEEYTRKDGTKGRRIVLTTDSGFGAISDSGVLTETHTIYVKAFDRAGNEAKSEPVVIRVMHKPKESKKTSAAWPMTGLVASTGPGNRGEALPAARPAPVVRQPIAPAAPKPGLGPPG